MTHTIGQIVKASRVNKNLIVEDVYKITRIPVSVLHEIEDERIRGLSWSYVVKISRALDIDLTELARLTVK